MHTCTRTCAHSMCLPTPPYIHTFIHACAHMGTAHTSTDTACTHSHVHTHKAHAHTGVTQETWWPRLLWGLLIPSGLGARQWAAPTLVQVLHPLPPAQPPRTLLHAWRQKRNRSTISCVQPRSFSPWSLPPAYPQQQTRTLQEEMVSAVTEPSGLLCPDPLEGPIPWSPGPVLISPCHSGRAPSPGKPGPASGHAWGTSGLLLPALPESQCLRLRGSRGPAVPPLPGWFLRLAEELGAGRVPWA